MATETAEQKAAREAAEKQAAAEKAAAEKEAAEKQAAADAEAAEKEQADGDAAAKLAAEVEALKAQLAQKDEQVSAFLTSRMSIGPSGVTRAEQAKIARQAHDGPEGGAFYVPVMRGDTVLRYEWQDAKGQKIKKPEGVETPNVEE